MNTAETLCLVVVATCIAVVLSTEPLPVVAPATPVRLTSTPFPMTPPVVVVPRTAPQVRKEQK